MKLIYIAGPFTAPTQWQVAQNVRQAEDSGRLIALCGMFPVIPHVLGVHFGDECSAEFWYDGTLELMRRCDGVFLSPGWATSKGAQLEIGLPVADNTQELAMKLGLIKR